MWAAPNRPPGAGDQALTMRARGCRWMGGARAYPNGDAVQPGPWHAQSLPRRLLPAAARRRPCPPGGTLAVRPRPETRSRVGLLPVAVAHGEEPAQRPDVRR